MRQVIRYECEGCGKIVETPASPTEFGSHSWAPPGGLPWYWTAQGYVARSEADCQQKQADWQDRQKAWQAKQRQEDAAREQAREAVVVQCQDDEVLHFLLAHQRYDGARDRIEEIANAIHTAHLLRDAVGYDWEGLIGSSSTQAETFLHRCFAAAGYAHVDPYA